jgi:hypothetical protein
MFTVFKDEKYIDLNKYEKIKCPICEYELFIVDINMKKGFEENTSIFEDICPPILKNDIIIYIFNIMCNYCNLKINWKVAENDNIMFETEIGIIERQEMNGRCVYKRINNNRKLKKNNVKIGWNEQKEERKTNKKEKEKNRFHVLEME